MADSQNFASVLDQAKQVGLELSQSFEDLGIASGSISQREYPALLPIKGLSVETDRRVGIPKAPRDPARRRETRASPAKPGEAFRFFLARRPSAP